MAILSSVFLFALDQAIVADITPPVLFHFGSVERLPWISVALLLAVGGTVNFWYDGFAADIHSTVPADG